jgi:hypothetical protein
MEEKPIFTAVCNNYFDRLLSDSKDSGNWEVTIEQIEK